MRWAPLLFALVLLTPSAFAQTPEPPAMDLAPLQARAAKLFDAASVTEDGSAFRNACDLVMLCSQAAAAIIIIAGLVMKTRDETRQMDGTAAMIVKVAFLASVPVWTGPGLTAIQAAADAIGYKSVATAESSPLMNDLWSLLRQWSPPSSAALDAFDAQTPDNLPASGQEANWSLQAWHWARGVGVADASMFHALWQSTSGSIRAFVVFATCGIMATFVSLVIALTYISEVVRWVLIYGGCALAPLFIAGLGTDALRPSSIRVLFSLLAIALWPIGWALTNIVTHVMAEGTAVWMTESARTALDQIGASADSFAVAAPYIPWATLVVFVGLTLALCAWIVASVYYVPVLLGRMFGAAAHSSGSSRSASASIPLVATHTVAIDGTTRKAGVPAQPGTSRIDVRLPEAWTAPHAVVSWAARAPIGSVAEGGPRGTLAGDLRPMTAPRDRSRN